MAQEHLKRTLSARMLNMIAIGGSIGTGIFLASGNALHNAGPGGVLTAYAVMGLMVYFLMTSLGEMAAFMPTTGSFYVYAERFVDPALGFALGWNYWYNWAITVASEISAASLVMHFWWPHSSPLLWCSLFLFIIVGFNALSARGFGEAEYVFSLIKVSVIIVFIIAGFAILLGVTHYHAHGFQNWHTGAGPFPGGWMSVISAFMIAGFSFQGTELIGIAAGESANPEKNIPQAIKQVFWRILLFFILSIFVISLLIPHTAPFLAKSDVELSPFTLVFKLYQIPYAADVMNAVILVAILSAGNSGLYASTRMLWYLAKKGHVPKVFTRINQRGVPMAALIASTGVATLTFFSAFYGNGVVYFWLLNASSLSGFIAWLGIAISHYRFRRAYVKQGKNLADLPYRARFFPIAPLMAFGLCIIIIAGQNIHLFLDPHIHWQGIFVTYIGVPLFLILWLGYKIIHRTKVVNLNDCHFAADKDD